MYWSSALGYVVEVGGLSLKWEVGSEDMLGRLVCMRTLKYVLEFSVGMYCGDRSFGFEVGGS